jgi:hypothetical protein
MSRWGWLTMAEVADGGGGTATELEMLSYLINADRPEHIRASGSPWPGVARVVEQAAAVLEDGQVRLAEVWRSPAGQLYLSKMGEVTQAMREISVVARHNGQVMDAAADTLDAKQKDFAALSAAPITNDARTGFARAIVASLDESYQQATANFRPVPPPPALIEPEQPLPRNGSSYAPSRQNTAVGGGSMPSGGAPSSVPQKLPSWVPTRPSTAGPGTSGPALTPGGGPELQGITPGSSPADGWGTTPGGPGSIPGATPGGSTTAPGGWAPPPAAAGRLPFGPGRAAARPVDMPARSVDPRLPARQRPWPPGRPQTPGAPYPSEAAGRPAGGVRANAGQPGAMLGGIPAGAAGGVGRGGWQGYRRPAERFPTTEQTAVEPVIGTTPAEEPELVSTDYADEYGNRITIRRPA